MITTETLNQIAKVINEQAESSPINWPEELRRPFFMANAFLVDKYLVDNQSTKFLFIQTPGNQAQNVAALAAVVCSILKSPVKESDWIPESGQRLVDTKENKVVYIARISGEDGAKVYHLKTANEALHGNPNEGQLKRRYKPVNQENNRIRLRTEPIDQFWKSLFPLLKIEDGVLCPPLVIGNLNRTLDDCKIRSSFPILELGSGDRPMFPPVAIHAANSSKAKEYLKTNKDENRIIILIGRAATIQGLNAVKKWIVQGKAKSAILISQKWLDRKELGDLNLEIVRWVWGPALAPIIAGYKAGSFKLEEIGDSFSEELLSNFEKLRNDFFSEFQIKLNSQRFVFEQLGLIIPSQCQHEIKEDLRDNLKRTWDEILAETKDEMFQAGYPMPDLEKFEEAKNQLIKLFDFGKEKLERLKYEDYQQKSAAIIPDRLKDALVSQDRLAQWTMIHAYTLDEFLAQETPRNPFLFSLYGHGKKRGPIRLLLALMQKNTRIRLMAYSWEKEQYSKYIQSLSDWELFALRECKESGLIDFDIPVSHPVKRDEDRTNTEVDASSDVSEKELLDRLTDGGWQVRSKPQGDIEDESDPWIDYCEVEFETGEKMDIPANRVLPIKRLGRWIKVETSEICSGDIYLDYGHPTSLSTFGLIAKYWPNDQLLKRIKECSNSWKRGVADLYSSRFRGRDIKEFREHFEEYGLEKGETTLRNWAAMKEDIFFPSAIEDLTTMKLAGVRFHGGKTLEEIQSVAQGFDNFVIRFGKDLAAELRQFRIENKKGPKLGSLTEPQVEWIELNMLIEKVVLKIRIPETDE